jgi:hypothetical protein
MERESEEKRSGEEDPCQLNGNAGSKDVAKNFELFIKGAPQQENIHLITQPARL